MAKIKRYRVDTQYWSGSLEKFSYDMPIYVEAHELLTDAHWVRFRDEKGNILRAFPASRVREVQWIEEDNG